MSVWIVGKLADKEWKSLKRPEIVGKISAITALIKLENRMSSPVLAPS